MIIKAVTADPLRDWLLSAKNDELNVAATIEGAVKRHLLGGCEISAALAAYNRNGTKVDTAAKALAISELRAAHSSTADMARSMGVSSTRAAQVVSKALLRYTRFGGAQRLEDLDLERLEHSDWEELK